jgi:S-adenosylmethionine:tRNA ribosyltransferase-isomerase
MRPARIAPAHHDDVRLLVVDSAAGSISETRTPKLPALLSAGDLVVVNDAATLPGSLSGTDDRGNAVELRLIATDPERGPDHFWGVLFGSGDWRQRTEDRPPPLASEAGTHLRFGELAAEIVSRASLSPRLVSVRFGAGPDALWEGLYRHGRPVQYSYLAQDLPLWAVQTVYAARPWAFEMPSAGRPLSWEILLALRRRGVRWASLTHAAGLSATGDPTLDAALPLPERFEIPAATTEALIETRQRGGRVIAIGTTVVRALEGAAAQHGGVPGGSGITDLHIDAGYRLRIVDGIFSGIHATAESHFALLGAFAPANLLAEAATFAETHDFATHELGDAMLILP